MHSTTSAVLMGGNDNKNIYKFIKKKLKKTVYVFLIKNTFICWARLKTVKF